MLDKAFFSPSSVAVIGAAREPHKLGHSVLQNILQYGFQGKVYPINPTAGEILALPCYPRVTDVPNAVELAVLVVPPAAVSPAFLHKFYYLIAGMERVRVCRSELLHKIGVSDSFHFCRFNNSL